MTDKKCYPYTYAQTQSGNRIEFKNLSNIKNINSSFAQSSEALKGKKATPNRPSKLTITNFKCNLPTGSKVTKVTVHYCHQRIPKNQGKYPNIGSPTIGLVVNGHVLKNGNKVLSAKGKAPTNNQKTEKVSFKVNSLLQAFNNNTFGVTFDYPSNANDNDGYMRIYWVYLTVTYITSNFSLSIKKVSGGYNHEDYTIRATISNARATGYNPNVTITAPPGFTFKKSKNGQVKSLGNNNFLWKPRMTSKTKSGSVDLIFTPNVTYPSGRAYYDGVFRISEALHNHYAAHTARIRDRPVIEEVITNDDGGVADDDTSQPNNKNIIFVNVGEEFYLNVPDAADPTYQGVCGMYVGKTNETFEYEAYTPRVNWNDSPYKLSTNQMMCYQGVPGDEPEWCNCNDVIGTYFDQSVPFKALSQGQYVIALYDWYTWRLADFEEYNPQHELVQPKLLREVKIEVKPDLPNPPCYSVLDLTKEELDRLGDGENYIIQSFMRVNAASQSYVNDWGKNFRIGVFNNPIDENIIRYKETDDYSSETITIDTTDYGGLSLDEMFEHAEYWGNPPTDVNTFQSITTEFVYNKDYPLKIFFTGDYGSIYTTFPHTPLPVDFTEPCIVESDRYHDWEPNGIYPIPINNLIANDGSSAELTIPGNQPASEVIFSKFPLEDGYGNDEDLAIRGLGLELNIEKTDRLILYAKMKTPTGQTGSRSIIIDDYDTNVDSENNIEIGGVGDLWNLDTEDIVNLKDWDIELTADNTLTDTNAYLNYGNVKFIVYSENIEEQTVKVLINGEDLSYYGGFLTDMKVPAGLKTEVDYLNAKGSDLNDPYCQSIREKTIELKIAVDSCDINNSTTMLRQITQLLITHRDEFNRPIPKRLELSNYPGIYWEYILEDVMDADITISDYDLKAKLVVPSGTAYKKESTVTNNIGLVQGITAVKPIITVKTGSEENIEIREINTGQSFTMGFSGGWNNHIVEIDCEDRIVWLKENEDDTDPINISRYVDWSADWFRLFGEYEFETTNCTLYSVDYTERW